MINHTPASQTGTTVGSFVHPSLYCTILNLFWVIVNDEGMSLRQGEQRNGLRPGWMEGEK